VRWPAMPTYHHGATGSHISPVGETDSS
jgi:hypothetical protein